MFCQPTQLERGLESEFEAPNPTWNPYFQKESITTMRPPLESSFEALSTRTIITARPRYRSHSQNTLLLMRCRL
eukprot:scaffold3874_cov71-Skeletonema_dohrnii-CCMP3373.AAC.2